MTPPSSLKVKTMLLSLLALLMVPVLYYWSVFGIIYCHSNRSIHPQGTLQSGSRLVLLEVRSQQHAWSARQEVLKKNLHTETQVLYLYIQILRPPLMSLV